MERKWWKSGTAIVVWIAVGTVVVHLATGWRYGFDRDELMALDDARNLAWGYVQYPPMTAFFGWVSLQLFGTSLGGFRLFASLAQAAALVLTGLMAKQMGGGKWPMVVATLAGVPFCLGAGALMSYISFDYVRWVLVAYCVVRVVGGGKQWQVASSEWREESERVEEYKSEREGEEGLRDRVEEGKSGSVAALGMKDSESRREDRADMGRGMQCPCEDEQAGEKWWVGVGVGMGLGMLAKYTMGFLAVGVVVGVLATEARKYLRSVWLWMGVLVAWVIFLPNLVWEWRRDFVSLDFLRFLHVRDVSTGVTDWFLLGQLELTMLMAPLALAGIWFCFEGRVKEFKSAGVQEGSREERRNWKIENGEWEEEPKTHPQKARVGHPAGSGGKWRILGWMYVVPLVLFLVMRGRDYYLAPAYPMLYAAGAVWIQREWLVASGEWRAKKSERVKECKSVRDARLRDEIADLEKSRCLAALGMTDRRDSRHSDRREVPRSEDSARNDDVSLCRGKIWRKVIWVALAMDIVAAGAVALPIVPIGTKWWQFAAKVDVVFPDEIGWPEFVAGVAKVRDALPEEERGRVGILAGNYGEVGALNLYGEKYGLPRAMSGVNSSWERGYGDPAEVLIVVGYPRELLEQEFASVVVAGRTRNSYRVANEETVEDPDIFVCRGMKESWEKFWGKVRKFA